MGKEATLEELAAVFGDSPTQESVVRVFKISGEVAKLAAELNSWLEIDSVTVERAHQLLEITMTNNFGPDSIRR